MSKFKVGDKVITRTDGMYDEVSPGDKGVVVEGSGQRPHGCCVKLDKLSSYLFFYWDELEPRHAFTIHSGDYIDSREFTREECERFCELAVECGFGRGEWADNYRDSFHGNYLQIYRDELLWCGDVDFGVRNANNITTQFCEFLDKEKGMKQFTKDDLKDGMCVTDREGDTYYVTGQSIQQCWIDSKEHHKASLEAFESNLNFVGDDRGLDIIRVTDRDGTVLFEREPELKEITLKLTQEQIDSLKEQGIG